MVPTGGLKETRVPEVAEGEGGPEGFVEGEGGGDKVLRRCCKVKIGKNWRFSLVRGGGKRSARKVR